MPASIKLKEEYGDDLAVIFVESQGATLEKAEEFALKQKWLGYGAMWTTERPLDSPGNGLPAFVLLSRDGEILAQGNPLAMKKDIEEGIAQQLKLRDEPPDGTPKELEKAWKDFAKGDVADALERARKVATDEPELAGAAESTEKLFLDRSQARIDRVARMIETGSFAKAIEEVDELDKLFKGCDELTAKLAEQRGRLEAEDMKAEIEADEALTKELQKLAGKSKRDAVARSLAKISEKYAGTRAAERAGRYATALSD